jgi:tripartite-type tricarboxylate transporter receptor subunit TctC
MAKWNGWLLSVIVAAVLPVASAAGAQTPPKEAAQPWPVRPVRIIVAFSPGSASDIIARLLAPKLSELWGQPAVIENRSGAGGSIAFAMTAQAAPDGYTIVLVTSSFAINAKPATVFHSCAQSTSAQPLPARPATNDGAPNTPRSTGWCNGTMRPSPPK